MSPSPRLDQQLTTVYCALCRPADDNTSGLSDDTLEVSHTICPQCQARYFEIATEKVPARLETTDNTAVTCLGLGSGVRLLLKHRWAATYPALRAIVVLALTGLWAGCGAREPQGLARTTMPNPDGCFVRVWNERGFTGASDFINGPVQYQHLRDMPNRQSWKDRIGSLTLGPNASAVVWSKEGFTGLSVPLTADSKDHGKFAMLPVRIQSLDVRC